jgi:hypothetical protein
MTPHRSRRLPASVRTPANVESRRKIHHTLLAGFDKPLGYKPVYNLGLAVQRPRRRTTSPFRRIDRADLVARERSRP